MPNVTVTIGERRLTFRKPDAEGAEQLRRLFLDLSKNDPALFLAFFERLAALLVTPYDANVEAQVRAHTNSHHPMRRLSRPALWVAHIIADSKAHIIATVQAVAGPLD